MLSDYYALIPAFLRPELEALGETVRIWSVSLDGSCPQECVHGPFAANSELFLQVKEVVFICIRYFIQILWDMFQEII